MKDNLIFIEMKYFFLKNSKPKNVIFQLHQYHSGKNAFLAINWSFVRQPHNFICWATSMLMTSISTDVNHKCPKKCIDDIGHSLAKVSFLGMCSKMQIIPIKNLNIKKVVPQFLWFFRLKCWFKGQIISRIHLSLPNAYKLICFDRNINGNRDVKFLIAIIGHCTDQRKLL